MNSEDEIASLVRKYVDTSVGGKHGPEFAVALAKRKDETLRFLQTEQFDSYLGLQRFWLYALVGSVAPEQKISFFVSRLVQEDDRGCLLTIQAFLKLGLSQEQVSRYFPDATKFKSPLARKIADELQKG